MTGGGSFCDVEAGVLGANHPLDPGMSARTGDADWLAVALTDSRSQTLATFSALQQALAEAAREVPSLPQFNPPLWELGHIGWFQAHWVGRNPQRLRGWDAEPDAPRLPAPRSTNRSESDALYDSANVPHATRWSLPLPDADATRADLAAQLEQTLSVLKGAPHDDRALYFHRLVLLHEDMHHEAALYRADALQLELPGDRLRLNPRPAPGAELRFDPVRWLLGSSAAGFVFDNELGAHGVDLGAFSIDAQVVRWVEFLPFIEAGGYDEPRFWSAAGIDWLRTRTQAPTQTHAAGPGRLPAALRRNDRAGWQLRHRGRWQALDPALPACHLSFFEAEAWCAWAGRRLPTEAEWERAALSASPQNFHWGDVWEWSTSRFDPYPGFVAHPYRDYSAPFFGSRPVLRGASFATHPRMRHPRYRNYFTPERDDIHAGFRSCAISADLKA